jgi:hypothetical protein
MKPLPPTIEQYTKYHQAWDYFNRELFKQSLNPCILNFSRQRGAAGFYHHDKWYNLEGEPVAEISLNPDCLGRPLQDSMGRALMSLKPQEQQQFAPWL